MEKIIITIIYSICLFEKSLGGDMMEESIMCRNIALSIHDEFLRDGKSIPFSFEEMETMNQMAESGSKNLRALNRVTVVPGVPTIQQQDDIPRNLWNHRLFAIYRESLDLFWNMEAALRGIRKTLMASFLLL